MRYLVLLTVIVLCSCSTLGVSTPKLFIDKDQNIEEFIYKNFSGWGPDRFENVEKKKVDGVLYSAPFNSMSSSYLKKPRNDIESFCHLQNGTLIESKGSDSNIQIALSRIIDQRKSPTAAMLESIAYSLQRGSDSEVAMEAGQIAYRRQIIENSNGQFRDVVMASSVISQSLSDGDFGTFTCVVNSAAKWNVVIELEYLRVGNTSTNLMDVPKGYIRIRGWQSV